jgi:hypothetical protein
MDMHRRQGLFAFVVLCLMLLICIPTAWTQANTATLSGVITDPQGLAVVGAKVTATSLATNSEKTTTTDDGGHYILASLPPGLYKLRIEGGSNFAPYENSSVKVTVGEEATLNVRLSLGTQTQVVTVTIESAPVETTRSESAQTVEQRQINNLPINGRSYINFTLTNSQTTRDVSPTIGPAPNSGLNISGARGRSNMVSVDGADAVDNSVNGIRSTVSQEAVQEFQMILSNYNAEYGRATGGVVNIVTKSGSNEFHGDVFGYLRNTAFQARNPFSGEVNSTGDLVPVKQSYTRVQTGATLGGALKKDKTFYFFSYEYTQREEAGFSSIGVGQFGLTTGNIPCIANPSTGAPIPLSMTPSQLTTYQQDLGGLSQLTGGTCQSSNPAIQGQIQNLQTAALVTGTSSNVAVNADMNVNVDGTRVPLTSLLFTPTVAGLLPNSKFFPSPVPCPLTQQVNSVICLPNSASTTLGAGFVPLPASYVGLNSLRGNFPVTEKTSLWSVRLDQVWSNRNSSFLRVGVSPSLVTGIQSTSQNQVFGQNAGSRTGLNQSRDFNVTFEHNTTIDDATTNQFRFQFARRGLHFGYSNLPGGSAIGVNIPGYAYFGREPYSTVDRIEKRWEFTDALTHIYGHHTFKFGIDANIIGLSSSKPQIFELDFGGDVNFGGLSLFGSLPGLTAAQAYGIGIPQTYIQGIGTSSQSFSNVPFGFFAQDTWRINRKLTLNYGLRYDVELTPLFAPATPINAAAEKALGVVEGIPRDYNNVAPRIGIAWDPKGDGKTVVRAGYGLFYDHPLLAIAFDSTTADGARSVQLISGPGAPSACGLVTPACGGGGLDTPTNLNGSSIFQGTLNALPSMYYLPQQQRFNPLAQNSIFVNQNYLNQGFPLPILPFVLPVAKNFVYGYAQQANLTVEHAITDTWKISAGYQWTRGIHLNRPVDINSTDPVLLTNNLLNAEVAGLNFASPLTVAVPTTDVSPTASTCGLFVSATQAPGVLGVLGGCPSSLASFNGKFVGTPAFFNYFRPSGPNPSFAGLVPGGYGTQVALAHAAGFPVGFGVPVPFNTVDAQLSDASSWYNALTINVSKRFSSHFELLSSYTWSHSIDNGTDLQSTLEPADSRFPYLERGNSVNDQPQRWVTSGVFQSSPHKSGESFVRAFFSNFTVAPLVEVSSGRPFNIITGEDTRLDLGASSIRPSIVPLGTAGATTDPYIPNAAFLLATQCVTNQKVPFSIPGITPPAGCTGTLGRDKYYMPGFFQFDMRLAKAINFGERLQVQVIADAFNLFNHTNILAVNQLCDPSAGPVCTAGQPTAAYDARQFQFALKITW